jgi:hypothetical protein
VRPNVAKCGYFRARDEHFQANPWAKQLISKSEVLFFEEKLLVGPLREAKGE